MSVFNKFAFAKVFLIIIFSAGATLAYKYNNNNQSKISAITAKFKEISKTKKSIFVVTGSWCGACQKTIPYLEEIYKTLDIPIYLILHKETKEQFKAAYPDLDIFKEIIEDENLIKMLDFHSIPQVYVVKKNKMLHIPHSLDKTSNTKILQFLKK